MPTFIKKYFFIAVAVILAIFFIVPINLSVDAAELTVTVVSSSLPQCSDGLDNDGDGKIDFPDDPGCSDASDNNETDTPVCGDGLCNSGETCGTCPSDCGVCPSGGGGGYVPPATNVIFFGRAYPKSSVTLLKDAQIAATTVAGADANFFINLAGLSSGNYIFSVYAEDNKGNRSSLLTFPISVTAGATTNVSGIFLSPTISVDKSEVKRGDNIAIFGQSAQSSEITIMVSSEEEYFVKTSADEDGIYLYNFDTAPLEIGQHFTKSKSALGEEISSFSKVVGFAVGTISVSEKVECGKADLNCDGRVNLVDFSIAAYWYKRPLSVEFIEREKERLNGDGKVNLVDFSIMAYYWTG